jgi:hypothetical protein
MCVCEKKLLNFMEHLTFSYYSFSSQFKVYHGEYEGSKNQRRSKLRTFLCRKVLTPIECLHFYSILFLLLLACAFVQPQLSCGMEEAVKRKQNKS